ncbi:MAG: hypothetical protein EXR51_04020 [Dehalococcoidia bacterium]|nr:hypothetical protein [Dehalococcoidia bacterium]
MPNSRRTVTWLTPNRAVAAITLVGLALRLAGLDADSLWFDTAHSGVVALNPTVAEVVRGAAADYQSPLYFVLLHWWLQVSHTDLWLRLPTALLGTAVIPLTYALGRRLFGDWAGVLAALFCTLTSYQVYYSRYPRSYLLLTLLAVAAALSLYEALRRGGRQRWAVHGGAVALALYTHPYAFFLLPPLWGWALLWSLLRHRIQTLASPQPCVVGSGAFAPPPKKKRGLYFWGNTPRPPALRRAQDKQGLHPLHPRFRPPNAAAKKMRFSWPGGVTRSWAPEQLRTLVPLFLTAGITLAAYLPWLGVSWAQWGGVAAGADAWIEPVTRDTLKTIYDWMWFKTRLDYNLPLDLLLRGGRYLFSALLLAAWWWGRRRWETWYAAGLTLLPIALPLGFSIVAVPLLDPRYLVVASPFLALWVGQAVAASGTGLAGLITGRMSSVHGRGTVGLRSGSARGRQPSVGGAPTPPTEHSPLFFPGWGAGLMPLIPGSELIRRVPEAGRRCAPPVLALLLVLTNLPPLWSLYFDPAFASPDERAANAWLHERYTEGDLLLHLDYQSYLPALWYDHQRIAMGRPAPSRSHAVPCTWESLPDAWCDASPYRRSYVNLDLQPLDEALKGERHIWLTTLYNHNKPAAAAQAAQRVEQLMAGRYAVKPAAAFLGVQLFELTAR